MSFSPVKYDGISNRLYIGNFKRIFNGESILGADHVVGAGPRQHFDGGVAHVGPQITPVEFPKGGPQSGIQLGRR